MRLATLKEIMDFFSTPDRPVTPPEAKAFWTSLDDEQKTWYKQEVGKTLA